MATQTVEQVTRLAPFQEEFLKDIFAQAKALQDVTQPFAPQQAAGLQSAQQQAIAQAQAGIGGYQPYLQQAQAASQRAGAFTDPGAVQQFFNPYENQVVQQTMQDIARAGEKQQQQAQAGAVRAGAFGGSRQAVLQGEIGRNVMEQQARSAGQLRQQGFQQAQTAAQRAAQLSAQQAQLSGALGGQAQRMGIQDINTLMGIGSLQQSDAQRQLDIQRANLLAQQALPFQQVGFMSDVFRGVPALQQTFQTNTTPPPSQTSQLLGLGIAGLGAVGAAGGMGNFFGF